MVDVAVRSRPLLTICTPTYERPELLRRALGSVVSQVDARAGQVELVVSDNSLGDEPEAVARAVLERWPGPSQYVRNRPSVGMIENHNRCLDLARGRFISFLQDDDLLVQGGLTACLDVVSAPDAPAAHLFGVDVVRMDGRIRRRQRPRRDVLLDPGQALRRLLTDSSYVRLPAMVVSAEAYSEAGPFDDDAGNAIDLDMWVRLFARHGLHTVPRTIAAYTVHAAAITSGMFTPEMVARLLRIFDRAAELGVLDRQEIRRAQAAWFHKFLLAGAYRHLEVRDRAGAAEVLALFERPDIRRIGLSVRWLPVRLAFTVATLGARRPASATAGTDGT
jgi:glycosyltransferase involved in cell wall biosynthesis